jgi:hypothetical protein
MSEPVEERERIPGPLGHYKRFKTEIGGYISYSERWARVFGIFYYTLRTLLIVLSASVAANGILPARLPVPMLSFLVAVGTAIDTWLKTGTRYKGHYTFHDRFLALFIEVELTDPENTASLERLKDRFMQLIEDYGVAALPS